MDQATGLTPNPVFLYTDGSCRAPGHCGGWAFIVRYPENDSVWVGYGSSPETTNNRMELMAVKQGLLFIRASDLPCIVTALEMGHCASAERMNQPKKINVITDSAYVVEGATLWLQRWRQKDWMAVAHHDLWQSIGEAMDRDQITFHHVRGHQGHAENEVCDRLAAKARKEQTSEEFIRPNWVEFRKQVLESD